MTGAPQLEWLELAEPADDFDEPALSLIARYVAVANRVTQHFWGDDSHDTTVDEIVAALRRPEDEVSRRLLVTEGGVDVGRAVAAINGEAGSHVGYISAWLVPEARSRGIGRAMALSIERVGIGLGATTLQAWADHRAPAAGDAGMAARSGHGAIAADAPAHLLVSLGYSLEQVERVSELDVEAARAALEAHRADALAHAGEAYAVRSWQGPTPPELLDAMAALHSRMTLDAPSAAMDIDDEHWDAARLQRLEAQHEASGQTMLQAVAFHVETGDAVAYTILLLPEAGRPAFQEDTLVHADHRGHRLGMLVKTENLLQLGRLHPDRTRIITWNAEENRPMLRVNEALGFVPVGAEGGWQRRVGSAESRTAAPATMGA